MQTPCHITVDPDGYTPLVVDIQRGGVSVSALSRQNGNTHDAISFPATITGPTVFWLADGVGLTVSMKVDGHEIAADGATPQSVSVPSSGGVAVRPQADALRTAAAGGSGTSSQTVVSKTANYSAAVGDVVIGDATGGGFTVTLPAPASGATVAVKNVGSGTVTIAHHATELVEGDGSVGVGANQCYTLISDGTDWWKI